MNADNKMPLSLCPLSMDEALTKLMKAQPKVGSQVKTTGEKGKGKKKPTK